MRTNISQIIQDLHNVMNLLGQYVQAGSISVDEGKVIMAFFSRYQNTNDLVYDALEGIKERPAETKEAFSLLQKATDEVIDFYASHSQTVESMDFQTLAKEHLRPFEEQHKEDMDAATASWRDFQSLSNRLDYMDDRDEDYFSLQKELNEKEAHYKLLHARVEESYTALRAQQDAIASLYFFKMEMLLTVIDKMNAISRSVIADIEMSGKGDCL